MGSGVPATDRPGSNEIIRAGPGPTQAVVARGPGGGGAGRRGVPFGPDVPPAKGGRVRGAAPGPAGRWVGRAAARGKVRRPDCKPGPVPRGSAVTVISLARRLPGGSSDLPGGRSGPDQPCP